MSIMAESSTSKTISVILLGATGITGKEVLGKLLSLKQEVSKVTLFGRRKATQVPESYGVSLEEEEQSGRLVQHVVDFKEVTEENSKQLFEGHTTYISCFGTTRRDAGSAQAFKDIDFGYNLKFATIAKAADVPHLSLMSTASANAGSFLLYLSSKGKLDDAVCDLKSPVTSIFRPTMLDRGEQARFLERMAGYIMKKILPSTVAKAIVKDALEQRKRGVEQETRIIMYENQDILEYTNDAA